MGIKEKYQVKSVDSYKTKEWILKKHYAGRMPSISYSFGLYDETNILNGVITFGMPQSPDLRVNVCGEKYYNNVYELNRLCVNDGLEKNVLSFFVSQSLKMLPDMTIVVSYADANYNHHGYIYQATNFYYTGNGGDSREFLLWGKQWSTRSLKERLKNNKQWDYNLTYSENVEKLGGKIIKLKPKYRYVFFCGNKKQKKELLNNLKWDILEYPKGQNERYDSSYNPTIQTELF